ncbi:SDR family oxidoreductase [Gallaecimonas mangrovi]|uniref:SDR family oxidoreductase n=1 Tax=Gallaecimonas mangrovi TaxID=2291597 RepID=UPI000E1FDF3C|nr:SDR family oxidoreductase [Gallaecimonas mangrovi]
MQTILITGCSSGFGLEIAKDFLKKGWRVIATMRNPQQNPLPPSENLQVLKLDVTDASNIAEVAKIAGPIDVLVNNAGVGLAAVLEGVPMATVRSLFESNTFGLMALTQAFLPQFRAQGHGTIINVSSSVTLRPLPMLSVYAATKAAVNIFSECLGMELAPFNVQVKLLLPGMAPETTFGQNGMAMMERQGVSVPEAYTDFVSPIFASFTEPKDVSQLTQAKDVVAAVWQAIDDPNGPMKIPAGVDAQQEAASQR